MDPRLHAGLGDDQRLRLLQEGEDLRRVVHRRPAPAQGRGAGIAEHAEARPLDQRVGIARDAVLLHAEDEELAVRQPFEEGARLLGLRFRHRRRPAPEIGGEVGEARQHGVAVVTRQGDVAVDGREGVQEPLAGLNRQAVEMDVDEALARETPLRVRGRLSDHPDEPARAVPLHAEDRVRDELRSEALLGQFGQGRVQQESPVVVDDLEDRRLARTAVAHQLAVAQAHSRRVAGPAGLGQEGAGAGGEVRQDRGVVGGEILRCHAAEQVADEAARAALLGDDVGGRLYQPGAGRLLLRGGQRRRGLECHRASPEPGHSPQR